MRWPPSKHRTGPVITIDERGLIESIQQHGGKSVRHQAVNVIGQNINVMMPDSQLRQCLALELQGSDLQRRGIIVRGIVQGVGFRSYVHGLASRMNLCGFVQNHAGRVRIEVEGDSASVDRFVGELIARPPRLAQIHAISSELLPSHDDHEFRIENSDGDAHSQVFISPDVATCDDCLAELFDAKNRRFQYPFITCTNCGPRLTIITGAPFDRPQTTMSSFPLCDVCRAEYENPSDRRYHAQAIACPACGPRLQLQDPSGNSLNGIDALAGFVDALRAGKIGALKGLGGYHLACDAGNESVVAQLRMRKHRDDKPFAIMVQDIAKAEMLCEVQAAERELLLSPQRPIVLLRRRLSEPERWNVADGVACDNPLLGVMLPYTPIHHLLLNEWGATPLVMTSGNRSDEPIAYDDGDAVRRLAGIADLFLTHDRPIQVRCDDSVTRIVGSKELPLRRSRGYAPQPIRLPIPCSGPILAVGGQFKATFALGSDDQAFVSHHLGDLDHYAAYRAFERDILLYQESFGIQPDLIVHDLHPEYASTRYGQARAREGALHGHPLKLLAVQHHHAHIASCMTEHGLTEPVIGVAFDGTGFGTDGTIWGGEFLLADYRRFRRAAHLRPVAMPGGDQAIREPWRMAAAHLLDAGCDCGRLVLRVAAAELRTIEMMINRRFNSPLTSSVGRLFDAVAVLAGICERVRYEGQAAMQLEWLATESEAHGEYPFTILEEPADNLQENSSGTMLVVDTRPLIRAVAHDAQRSVQASLIARQFHSTVASIVVNVCRRLRIESRLNAVVLSGGVFMNALLTCDLDKLLADDGFRVYRHCRVPPNDGGLSLGQLAVGAAQQANGMT